MENTCKLKLSADNRALLTSPNGEELPFIVKDSLEIIVGNDLFKNGMITVKAEFYIDAKELEKLNKR